MQTFLISETCLNFRKSYFEVLFSWSLSSKKFYFLLLKDLEIVKKETFIENSKQFRNGIKLVKINLLPVPKCMINKINYLNAYTYAINRHRNFPSSFIFRDKCTNIMKFSSFITKPVARTRLLWLIFGYGLINIFVI